MGWLSDNISTVIIALVLAAVVAGVIAFMTVRHKKGRGCCSGSCGGCSCCGAGHSCAGKK